MGLRPDAAVSNPALGWLRRKALCPSCRAGAGWTECGFPARRASAGAICRAETSGGVGGMTARKRISAVGSPVLWRLRASLAYCLRRRGCARISIAARGVSCGAFSKPVRGVVHVSLSSWPDSSRRSMRCSPIVVRVCCFLAFSAPCFRCRGDLLVRGFLFRCCRACAGFCCVLGTGCFRDGRVSFYFNIGVMAVFAKF